MVKYQVCFDIEFYGKVETRICYETDSQYDAQCYIGEMYRLGDYSNYYIKEVIR